MYRVLLIEDEVGIRRRLTNAIDWEQIHCVLCGEADSGMAGFEMILYQKPDIVITDIVMPGLDGLTLLQYVRQRDIRTQFIFLTGYQKFEYAKEALRLGAISLLTKPIVPDELKSAVLQAIYVLNKNFESRDSELEAAKRDNTLEVLLKGQVTYPEEAYNAMMERYGLADQDFAVITARLDEVNDNVTTSGNTVMIDVMRRHAIRQGHLFAEPDGVFGTMVVRKACMPKLSAEALLLYAKTLHAEMDDELGPDFKLSFSLGVSSIGKDARDLARCFHESVKASANVFFSGANSVIQYSNPDHNKQNAVMAIRKINQLLEKNTTAEAFEASLYSIILDMNEDDSLDGEMAKGVIIIALSSAMSGVINKESSLMELLVSQSDCLGSLIHSRNALELARSAAACFEVIRNCMTLRRGVDKQEILKRVVRYIEMHYARDISLTDVAESVNLSPSYLSNLIRMNAQQNFVDILCGVRIRHAKELLTSKAMKINEVAEKTGFNDARYFSQVFKRATGMTPTEFIQMNMSNDG